MIAIDSSSLIEVAAGQNLAERCQEVLLSNDLIISAATLTEVLIVSARMKITEDVTHLLALLEPEVQDVDGAFAVRAANAYRRWGKGFHRAGLNYGDSFSYALAEMYDCPLLFIGDDFARTDVRSALS